MDATLTVERDGPVARVTLSRPETRNAFNAAMIADLAETFTSLGRLEDVRVVVLAGEGKVFSAGADLEWMRTAATLSEEQNVADALRLADMLAALRDCAHPVVARVHGAAMGGGAGLLAAADIAVAEEGTRFAFSEVRLGLVPAVISPFVVPKIGLARARELFLTGETFDAARAQSMGLVGRVVPADELDAAVDERVAALLAGGPDAQGTVKQLLAAYEHPARDLRGLTARYIAARRASPEGREGTAAFLERRPPSWRPPE